MARCWQRLNESTAFETCGGGARAEERRAEEQRKGRDSAEYSIFFWLLVCPVPCPAVRRSAGFTISAREAATSPHNIRASDSSGRVATHYLALNTTARLNAFRLLDDFNNIYGNDARARARYASVLAEPALFTFGHPRCFWHDVKDLKLELA